MERRVAGLYFSRRLMVECKPLEDRENEADMRKDAIRYCFLDNEENRLVQDGNAGSFLLENVTYLFYVYLYDISNG